ncbi:MAG: HD domain-containing protein [Cytophagales bacterium]|nr:HD domain-containing protein [Cytophagales bacterium]
MSELIKSIKTEPIDIVKGHAQSMALETYVIGGYVRDQLLNRSSKDIDFVCIGNGIELAKRVSKAMGKDAKFTVFKNYGTASIHWKGHELEFVGARKESYRSESRNPEVSEGTLEDDQNRRDFTINALAISLNKGSEGELLDPFEGQRDLDRKLIRTPLDPQVTFSDDPLRMMRAIRFSSQLGFDIDADTFDALNSQRERLKIISQERISDELNKIILSPKPSYGFKLLFHSGILEIVFPEMYRLQGVKKVGKHTHKDNFYHTLEVLDNISEHTDDLWLRWAAILHDIAKPATQRFNEKSGWTFHGHEDMGSKWVPNIFKRMKLPLNEKMKYVQKMVRLHLRPIALVKNHVSDSAVRRLLFDAGEDVEDLMTLCNADITSKNPEKVRKYMANFKKVQAKMKEVEANDHVRDFQPPITGEDILAAYDIKPSRVIAEIKAEIKESILDGKIPNEHDPARELMLTIGSRLQLPLRK